MSDPVSPDRAPLSPSAEVALVLAACEGPGPARNRLLEALLPRIAHAAYTLSGSTGVDLGEIVHRGVTGVLRALDRFDPTLGTPFWSYASWWARAAMQQLTAEPARGDRAQLEALSDRERQILRGRYGLDGQLLTASDLAQTLGLRPFQVRENEHQALVKLSHHPR